LFTHWAGDIRTKDQVTGERMTAFLINIINIIVQLITLLVIIKVFLSYFMSPYHPVRLNIDRIVEPMLIPIRRIIPPIGMLDISPIVLIVIVQIIGRVINNILVSGIH
jgi:YggT family protein